VVIDIHTHAFPDDLAPRAIEALNSGVPPESYAVLDGTLGDLLRSMDRAGIERSVLTNIATAPKQVDSILEWSLSIAGERIIPFASVHPGGADVAADVRKIAESGLRGVKMHPQYQEFAIDEERMWPFYEAMSDAGLVLLFHAGRDIAFPPEDDRAAPRRILRVHQAFPDLPIVAAHLGGWMMWQEVAETLAGTDVYLDTSYTFHQPDESGAMADILRRHPVERIAFGTDSPWRDQAADLARVREVFPDEPAQELVLHGNAERLLGL